MANFWKETCRMDFTNLYKLATIGRLDTLSGFSSKTALFWSGSFEKEAWYSFEATDRSHPNLEFRLKGMLLGWQCWQHSTTLQHYGISGTLVFNELSPPRKNEWKKIYCFFAKWPREGSNTLQHIAIHCFFPSFIHYGANPWTCRKQKKERAFIVWHKELGTRTQCTLLFVTSNWPRKTEATHHSAVTQCICQAHTSNVTLINESSRTHESVRWRCELLDLGHNDEHKLGPTSKRLVLEPLTRLVVILRKQEALSSHAM